MGLRRRYGGAGGWWGRARFHWGIYETQSRYIGAGALLAMALVSVSCGGGGGSPSGDSGGGPRPAAPLQVVTGTAIVADWVRQIGGARVAVEPIVPAGADVHTFALSPEGVIAIVEAELVILIGGGLEAAFERVVQENAKGAILELAAALPLQPFPPGFDEPGGAEGQAPGEFDPHFWQDPTLAIAAVDRIRAALSALDPAGATAYAERAAAYATAIRAVDAEIQELLQNLPPERRLLVTFHDAFGYLARRYGLQLLGVVVEGAEEEPSAEQTAALIETMRAQGVRYIFQEPQYQAPAVERIAAETGAEVRTLNSDTLTATTPTYLDLMRANAHAIAD